MIIGDFRRGRRYSFGFCPFKKLCYNLIKNEVVNRSNENDVIQLLHIITENLVWGDQHDPLILEYFIEHHLLRVYLHVMKESAPQVTREVLYNLNIMFQNIKNKAFIISLLSNYQMDEVVEHDFDFEREELVAYYITLLKSLSLWIKDTSIQFFYNEAINNILLFQAALRFLNHPERMIRISVFIITLNIIKSANWEILKSVESSILIPYFNKLVMTIARDNFYLDLSLDSSINWANHPSVVIENHVDYFGYINDIFDINLEQVNIMLSNILWDKLIMPVYICSLTICQYTPIAGLSHCLTKKTAIFFLCHVINIFTYKPLIQNIIDAILYGDKEQMCNEHKTPNFKQRFQYTKCLASSESSSPGNESSFMSSSSSTVNDWPLTHIQISKPSSDFGISEYYESLLDSLKCHSFDEGALWTLCFLSLAHKKSLIDKPLIDYGILNGENERSLLLNRILSIINMASQYCNTIRLDTLIIAVTLLEELIDTNSEPVFDSDQIRNLAFFRKQNLSLLVNIYSSEEMFLEIFEVEYYKLKCKRCTAEQLLSNPKRLLVGQEGTKSKSSTSEIQNIKKSVAFFILLRELFNKIENTTDKELPLIEPSQCRSVNETLNIHQGVPCYRLNHKENLTACKIILNKYQMLLVEKDSQSNCGVVANAMFLWNLDIQNKGDNSLEIESGLPLDSSKMPKCLLKFECLWMSNIVTWLLIKCQTVSKNNLKRKLAGVLQVPKNNETDSSNSLLRTTPLSSTNLPYHHISRSESIPINKNKQASATIKGFETICPTIQLENTFDGSISDINYFKSRVSSLVYSNKKELASASEDNALKDFKTLHNPSENDKARKQSSDSSNEQCLNLMNKGILSANPEILYKNSQITSAATSQQINVKSFNDNHSSHSSGVHLFECNQNKNFDESFSRIDKNLIIRKPFPQANYGKHDSSGPSQWCPGTYKHESKIVCNQNFSEKYEYGEKIYGSDNNVLCINSSIGNRSSSKSLTGNFQVIRTTSQDTQHKESSRSFKINNNSMSNLSSENYNHTEKFSKYKNNYTICGNSKIQNFFHKKDKFFTNEININEPSNENCKINDITIKTDNNRIITPSSQNNSTRTMPSSTSIALNFNRTTSQRSQCKDSESSEADHKVSRSLSEIDKSDGIFSTLVDSVATASRDSPYVDSLRPSNIDPSSKHKSVKQEKVLFSSKYTGALEDREPCPVFDVLVENEKNDKSYFKSEDRACKSNILPRLNREFNVLTSQRSEKCSLEDIKYLPPSEHNWNFNFSNESQKMFVKEDLDDYNKRLWTDKCHEYDSTCAQQLEEFLTPHLEDENSSINNKRKPLLPLYNQVQITKVDSKEIHPVTKQPEVKTSRNTFRLASKRLEKFSRRLFNFRRQQTKLDKDLNHPKMKQFKKSGGPHRNQ